MEVTERFWCREEGQLTQERELEIYEFANEWGGEEFGCHEFTEQSAAYHYWCTREKDHPGPHIALGETEVFAIWEEGE